MREDAMSKFARSHSTQFGDLPKPEAGPSRSQFPMPATSEGRPKGLKRWGLSVAGRRKSGWTGSLSKGAEPVSNGTGAGPSKLRLGTTITDPYAELRHADDVPFATPRASPDYTNRKRQSENTTALQEREMENAMALQEREYGDVQRSQERDNRDMNEGYEWEPETEDEEERQVDAYSWVDPSVVDTDQWGSRASSPGQGVHSPADSVAQAIHGLGGLHFPEPPDINPLTGRPKITPTESYNLLLSYQTSQSNPAATPPSSQHNHGNTSRTDPTSPTPYTASIDAHSRRHNPDWHDLVDPSIRDSLPNDEVRRQGTWWELISGELEYVRDLRLICESFISPLRNHQPPVLVPETRLSAFIAEVFSSVQTIYLAHAKLLDKLMDRQRAEWPLMTSATDLLLQAFLETIEAYETYLKNYPFADARVRRETERNPAFQDFLRERNTDELTRRRDFYILLSRPVTRLPRVNMLLQTIYKLTPDDHPDKEQLPVVEHILSSTLKGSQPGVETAEAKIKLWNVAERLLFKKGEIIELDITDNKRQLVHAGYVFRRVRSETNWHGWQDLHAFLLDNYFLLTRDEEHGKHVVVSRPIHLDFLTFCTASGAPERRYDGVSQYKKRPGDHALTPIFQPERLMFPFTIETSGGVSGRTYTLCTATRAARELWKTKIEGAKTLRGFDIETNRIFAVHNITLAPEIREPLVAADSFPWLSRETVAVATARSVWLGWKRDSHSFREVIRFPSGSVSTVTIIPDFSWLLVVVSGSLLAFNLNIMMPTHEPVTWIPQSSRDALRLSAAEHNVAFVKVGTTKGRLLVVHATHLRNSHQTALHFHEPLLSPSTTASTSFRHFAQVIIPGYATELSFFRQTIAVVTEKGFVIAEPGNPTYNSIPTFPHEIQQNATVVRMVGGAKPLAMFQIGENEFLLAYDWGACFVTKYGEVSRNGSFLRWNLVPSTVVYRPPHLLLFNDNGRAEVRDVPSGRVCELLAEEGLRPLKIARVDQALLCLCKKGLIELAETVEL